MGDLTVLTNALNLLTYTCESCGCLVLRTAGAEHEAWHDALEYACFDPDELLRQPPRRRPIVDLHPARAADGVA